MAENKYRTLHTPAAAEDLADEKARLAGRVAALERKNQALEEQLRQKQDKAGGKKGRGPLILGLAAAAALVVVGVFSLTGGDRQVPAGAEEQTPEPVPAADTALEEPAEIPAAQEPEAPAREPNVMVTAWDFEETTVWGNPDLLRSQIGTVTFLDTLAQASENAWDISEAQDGRVLVWAEENGEFYDLYVAGEGGVKAGTDCTYLFHGFTNLTEIRWNDAFDTSGAQKMWGMFESCSSLARLDLSGLDTSSAVDMTCMFYQCSGLTELDLSEVNTARVTQMRGVFGGCSSLTSLDVSGFITSNVADMAFLFADCSSLTALDVTGFYTSEVTDMYAMFYGCSGLTSLDVSGFDTSEVTDMYATFYGCSGLTSLNVSGFDTSSVTDMAYLFADCSSLAALDVSGFDTSNVTNLSYMFANCTSLAELDLSHFDTDQAEGVDTMLEGCTGLSR